MLQEVALDSIEEPIRTIESDGEEDEMLVDFNQDGSVTEDGNVFDLFNNFDI